MSIAADPAERFGNHDVVCITVPVQYVVLDHHGRDVRVEASRLRDFARRWGEEIESYRYQKDGFSWVEHMALSECGWSVTLSNGMSWPTRSLFDAVVEWEKRAGIR